MPKSIPKHYWPLMFIIGWLCVLAVDTVWVWSQPLIPIGLPDPDVWVRLSRVEHLYLSGDWYNRVVNMGGGIENHWTRPLDVMLLALAYPATFFVPLKFALVGAATLCNAILMLCTAIGISSLCRRLNVGLGGQWIAILLLVNNLSPQFALGRADHHGLLVCIYVWLLASVCHYSRERSATAFILRAGALAGLGLWVSPEFLMIIAGICVWVGVLWVFNLEPKALRMLQWFLLPLIGVSLLAVGLEWPPHQWMHVAHDRISIMHLHVLVVVLAGVALLSKLPQQRWQMRLLWGMGLAALSFAWLAFAHPRFYLGAMAETPAELLSAFNQLSEEQPLFNSAPLVEGGLLLLSYLFIIGYLGVLVRQNMRDTFLWLLILMTPLFACLTLTMVRWDVYGQISILIGCALIWQRISPTFAESSLLKSRLCTWLPSATGQVVWSLGLLGSVVALLAITGKRPATAIYPSDTGCIARMLTLIEHNAFPTTLNPTAAVIIHRDYAGHVLFWTPRHVIASNYNENAKGVIDLDHFWFAPSEQSALEIARRYKAGFVMLCPDAPLAPFFETTSTTPFLSRVLAGHLPAWLTPIPLDYADAPKLFQVKENVAQ